MTTETVLTDAEIITIGHQARAIEPGGNGYILPVTFARAIEQAVLQSAEIQRLKAIETAAGEVLSMPREDGYIVLTIHLDALRAAMEQQT